MYFHDQLLRVDGVFLADPNYTLCDPTLVMLLKVLSNEMDLAESRPIRRRN
jgi:hypothetical protein